jgi:hypothetical protein
MGVITIRGTLDEVRTLLSRVQSVVDNRNAVGWRVLQHDEDWFFFSERDAKVCTACLAMEGTVHRGDYVPERFPLYQFIDPTHIYPQVHYGCRCTLEWVDSAEKIRDRLDQEIRMVV